jgi:hypothetical protein
VRWRESEEGELQGRLASIEKEKKERKKRAGRAQLDRRARGIKKNEEE